MSDTRKPKNVTPSAKKGRLRELWDTVGLGTNDSARLFLLPVPDFAPALQLPCDGPGVLNDLYDGFVMAAEYALKSDCPYVLLEGTADTGLGIAVRILNTDQIVFFAPQGFYPITTALVEKIKKNMGIADPIHGDFPGGPFACYELPDFRMRDGSPLRVSIVASHREKDGTRAKSVAPELVTAA